MLDPKILKNMAQPLNVICGCEEDNYAGSYILTLFDLEQFHPTEEGERISGVITRKAIEEGAMPIVIIGRHAESIYIVQPDKMRGYMQPRVYHQHTIYD